MNGLIPFLFVILVTVATVLLGIWATRKANTASDFFVAGRSVGVFANASAISGEYLSAASFMGIAGLVMRHGYDALWYPVGYAAGYLFLLLFIAGPLRRFGAYTIPDFAEGRFDSPTFRKIAVIFVLFIGFFYTLPQMKGAGVTMGTILGWPYWAGILVVGTVITFNVSLGGMKGITLVQAFQYWAKAFAIAAPVFILMSVYGGYGAKVAENVAEPLDAPKVTKDTPLKWPGKDKSPNNAAAFSPYGETHLQFPKGMPGAAATIARKLAPDEEVTGFTAGAIPPTTESYTYDAKPLPVMRAGRMVMTHGIPLLTAPKLAFDAPTEAVLPAGSYVPNAQNNRTWVEPFGTFTSKHGYPVLYTYSLIIALVCGTAGLPHILVRFYTNPDGRAAKRTTLWVMVLLGAFYVFTPVWGALGRADIPALYANNKTDAVVIALPQVLQNKLLGQVLMGITSAGAFAAFMSTFSGLLVSMSGALAHDIYGKILYPSAPMADRLKAFKIAAVICGAISMALGLLVETFDITLMVGWAFAIAAASYFPLLLLGSWWRGLTKYGAAAGMLIGGTLSLVAIVTFMALEKKWIPLEVPPIVKALMDQPAIWGVPLSIAIMIVVSIATAKRVPADVDLKMLRLHAPEELGLSKNYVD